MDTENNKKNIGKALIALFVLIVLYIVIAPFAYEPTTISSDMTEPADNGMVTYKSTKFAMAFTYPAHWSSPVYEDDRLRFSEISAGESIGLVVSTSSKSVNELAEEEIDSEQRDAAASGDTLPVSIPEKDEMVEIDGYVARKLVFYTPIGESRQLRFVEHNGITYRFSQPFSDDEMFSRVVFID